MRAAGVPLFGPCNGATAPPEPCNHQVVQMRAPYADESAPGFARIAVCRQTVPAGDGKVRR